MIYAGDVGVTITLDCGKLLTGATAITMLYRKPSGLTGAWPAVLSGTTAIAYTTVVGDLDEDGDWELQGHMTLGIWTGHLGIAELTIGKPIAA